MPHATALLIVDVQQALCEGEWAAFEVDALIERINGLSARARSAGRPVIVVQHEEADGPMQHGTPGWQLAPRLNVEPSDPRVRKTVRDAFEATPLADRLHALGIDHLVVCGMQTEFCIASTVRGAIARGFGATLVSDAHSTLADGGFTAPQIIARHNEALKDFGVDGRRVRLMAAREIDWHG